MAILGSLRKNSVVLITVIGMALFAFVISGVFDGKGYVAQSPVGVVNGEDLSIEEMGERIFEKIIKTASGEPTKSEELGMGDNEFVPWQIGATM